MDDKKYSIHNPSAITLLSYLSLMASITAVLLIAIGSFVRVTGSGLACPDWPLCDGNILPPLEYHVLIEYSHRLVAAILSLLIVLLFTVSISYRGVPRVLKMFAGAVVFFLIIQIGLGWITVTYDLPPEIVAIHLANAEIILALLLAISIKGYLIIKKGLKNDNAIDIRTVKLSAAGALFILLIIISGSVVVGSSSVADCGSGLRGWPLCDGNVIPNTLDQLINVMHRILVLVVTPVLILLHIRVKRITNKIMDFTLITRSAITLYVIQAIVGGLIPLTNFSDLARVMHLLLASLTWVSLIMLFTFLLNINASLKGTVINGK